MNLALELKTGSVAHLVMHRAEAQSDGTERWQSSSDSPNLLIVLDERRNVITLEADDCIATPANAITEVFIDAYSSLLAEEASGIEITNNETDSKTQGPFPYNPESIRVDTKPFNIGLIYEMIQDGDINLSPDFQRHFVWTDIGARSRLIESIMLRIPLPVFYFAQEASGRFQVVDGVQRLTVIKQFLDNALRLRDLEYLKEEEGKVFRDENPDKCIDQRYRKRIVQTQIMANIIDPQTPADVKFDIFKRINQGGRPLNAQEIRNSMSLPETRSLLRNLAESRDFAVATTGSVGSVRMQDHELILRSIAFALERQKLMTPYAGNMERFLDQSIESLNSSSQHDALQANFLNSMSNCIHLFGPYAFRKCLPADLVPGARKRLINNSLFTTWSVVLGEYDSDRVRRIPAGIFSQIVAARLEADRDLFDAVSSGTNDRRRLNYAFNVTEEICRGHL